MSPATGAPAIRIVSLRGSLSVLGIPVSHCIHCRNADGMCLILTDRQVVFWCPRQHISGRRSLWSPGYLSLEIANVLFEQWASGKGEYAQPGEFTDVESAPLIEGQLWPASLTEIYPELPDVMADIAAGNYFPLDSAEPLGDPQEGCGPLGFQGYADTSPA